MRPSVMVLDQIPDIAKLATALDDAIGKASGEIS